MADWWASLASPEKFFWAISMIFSVLFFIQFILSLIGIDADVDADFDLDHDAGIGFLSVKGFIAFATFFGWTGVAVLSNGGGVAFATILATITGLAAMFLVGYVMLLFHKLQEDGTLKMENALDKVGEVYLKIPGDQKGTGKVQIKVQGSTRELTAMTEELMELPTGSKIRVIDIMDNEILIVEPVEKNYLPIK